VIKFPEILEIVTKELSINKLTDYIYDLACKISEGYKKYRIIDDPNKEKRILLIEISRRILKISFFLIGIEPLEKI